MVRGVLYDKDQEDTVLKILEVLNPLTPNLFIYPVTDLDFRV